jgi:signal peptidase I
MLPTIKPGDSIAVNLGAYVSRPIERYDMVVFTQPEIGESSGEKDAIYLQRVIALGGDKVEVRGGKLYVNGKEPTQPFQFMPHATDEEFKQITVPEGEYFLLGDNRTNSFDSRYWKKPTVDEMQIKGKVVEIIPQ